MRKLIAILLAIVTIHSCNETRESYSIEIDLKGTEGKWVKLKGMEDRNYMVFDSVLVTAENPAMLSKNSEGVTTMYLTVEQGEGSIQMFIENAEYHISGTMEDPVIKTSSKAQNDLNAYNHRIKPIADKMFELRTALQSASRSNDQAMSDSLRSEYYRLYEEQGAIDSVYIVENPTSFASVLALRGTFYMLDAEQLEATLTSLDPSLHQLEEYSYMNGKLERMKAVAIGRPYADFGLNTPEGELLKVSEVHNGNVLLIDFWASWCGPCRRANPELVEIYNEYHDQGFEILGVSLDRNAVNWTRAIADDGLTWYHISDLQYWNSEGAELYGVPAIPHAVLIDREGIIHSKKLHGDDLREAIESLL